PRVTNTLEWRINSEFAGEVQVEIRYFTSGISWSADYVLEAEKNEKLAGLAGYVRINNSSGEDYENAQVRLVVGVIRLVDDIARLARMGKPGQPDLPQNATAPAAKAELTRRVRAMEDKLSAGEKQVTKEELSEYFLYSVEGRDTIPTGWA